jgi:hypothetical protein
VLIFALICAVRCSSHCCQHVRLTFSFVLVLLRACLGSVRRLSTQTSRTPYNSNVTMSPAAAELIQAQQTAIVDAEARLSAAVDATSPLPGAIDTEAGVDAGRPRVVVTQDGWQQFQSQDESPIPTPVEEPAVAPAVAESAEPVVDAAETAAAERQHSVASDAGASHLGAESGGANKKTGGGKGKRGNKKGGR